MDLNGDGKLDYDNDQYGFSGWQYEQIPAMYIGLGGQVLQKDKTTKMPSLVVEDERTYKVTEAMNEVFKREGAFYHGTTYGLEDKMFSGGRLMFNDAFLSQLTGYRDMEQEFGFIPYPMLDEKQGEYYARWPNIGGLFYLPVTNTKTDFTGFIMEAMAEEAYFTVMPAYLDIVLTLKATRDTESEEMIPIIRGGAVLIDAATGFSPQSAMNGLSSYIAANLTKWQTTIEEMKAIYE